MTYPVMLAIGMALILAGTPFIAVAGETITGKVTYKGKPEEKVFLFSKFPNQKFCAKKSAQGVGQR